jgi:DNA-binding GntR family transcriptional regulator
VDDQPISIDQCIIPARNADQLNETDFASPLFYFRWEEKQGLTIHRTDQSIHTEPATPEDCEHLGLSSSVWMLVLNELFYDSESRVAGQIITRYRGDTSKLTTSVYRRNIDGKITGIIHGE